MDLKKARQRARLSQNQLAVLAGVDHSTISRVEAGRKNIGGMAYFSVVRIRRVLAPHMATEKFFPVPDVPVADREVA
jgi:transcriptional regulator with XRE-family HTH domain